MTSKTIIALHTLAAAAGTGAVSFLAGAFLLGIPTTKAGWLSVLAGATAGAMSRFFGALFKLIQPPSN